MKYILTNKAIAFLTDRLSSVEGTQELMNVLKLKEQQIKNVINTNGINGKLTSFAVVEYIKENSSLRSESKILETV